MNIFNLRHTGQTKNSPLKPRTVKRTYYTIEYLRRFFPMANLKPALINELNANSKEYEKNFKLMVEHKGDMKFIKIENELNKKDIAIRKKLRIYVITGRSAKKFRPQEANYEQKFSYLGLAYRTG